MSENRSRRRVVITGMGVVSPLGQTVQETWQNALEGRSGINLISSFDTTECPVKIAGEVKNFDPTREIAPLYPRGKNQPAVIQAVNKKDMRKMGRFIHLALVAGLEAYRDSGIDEYRGEFSPVRFGANIGVGMGGLPEIESIHNDLLQKGYKRVTPFFVPEVIANMASGQLSILLDLRGPNLCLVSACASSAHAIGESVRQIQRGDVDVMLVGGAESVISPLGVGGFASMRALSTRNDEPQRASRPYDVARDGFVMGEGSACLIIEDYEFAQKRGARIYGEIKGYGLSADAYHMTTPAPEGEGGFRAMEMALRDSGLRPEEIQYVNAHGTSTPAGDAEEAQAIARLFPQGPEHLHVSSTKSMTGHLLGGAGAIETVFSMLAIREGRIPPTINLDELDPACAKTGLDFTAHRAVTKQVDNALSNSFGFGGTNASLIVGRV